MSDPQIRRTQPAACSLDPQSARQTVLSPACASGGRPRQSGESDAAQPTNLRSVIVRLHRAARGADRVTVGDLVDAMGASSMAAVLLVPALLLISPLSGIPGASILGGTVIALISGQMVMRRAKVWLPKTLRRRSLPGPALRKALVWLRRPAQRLDGIAPARPGGGDAIWWSPALALLCFVLGLCMPVMEVIPFSSTLVATVVAACALSLLTGRVRFALVALALSGSGLFGLFWLL